MERILILVIRAVMEIIESYIIIINVFAKLDSMILQIVMNVEHAITHG